MNLVVSVWSVVKCRTLNRGKPGSNPVLQQFRILNILVLSTMPQCTRLLYELAIDSGGNM